MFRVGTRKSIGRAQVSFSLAPRQMARAAAEPRPSEPAQPVWRRSYSVSRRVFLRLRLRASACLTRIFSPGLR